MVINIKKENWSQYNHLACAIELSLSKDMIKIQDIHLKSNLKSVLKGS